MKQRLPVDFSMKLPRKRFNLFYRIRGLCQRSNFFLWWDRQTWDFRTLGWSRFEEPNFLEQHNGKHCHWYVSYLHLPQWGCCRYDEWCHLLFPWYQSQVSYSSHLVIETGQCFSYKVYLHDPKYHYLVRNPLVSPRIFRHYKDITSAAGTYEWLYITVTEHRKLNRKNQPCEVKLN